MATNIKLIPKNRETLLRTAIMAFLYVFADFEAIDSVLHKQNTVS